MRPQKLDSPGLGVPEVMTKVQVAAWLQVKPRQIDRLEIPCIPLGQKTARYLRADVLQWLEDQRKGK